MKILNWASLIFVVIGALNWALVGLFGLDLVGFIFGNMALPARIIYTLVGVAGVYLAVVSPKYLK